MAKHIWFSSATDVTGRALAERLNLSGTRDKPRNLAAGDILIGWGTKIDRNTEIPNGVHVLNHPNAIRKCRNKYEALKLMGNHRDMADYITKVFNKNEIAASIVAGDINFPIVGRKNFHQGGKDFWLCLTSSHLQSALNDGAQYFRVFFDTDIEYRLHVFNGHVIYAVKKVESPGEDHWAAQRKEKVMDYANKNNVAVDAATLDYVLGHLAKEAQLPDRIIRSNKRGWKFTNVRVNNLSANLKNAAIKAVEVLGLEFGAVDCAKLQGGGITIIEANSGPGLQGNTLEKYVEVFTAKIAELERPAPAPRKVRAPARPRRAVAGAAAQANEAVPADDAADIAIDPGAMRRMMNACANDEEARRLIDIIMQ